jgi:hypothetical protein
MLGQRNMVSSIFKRFRRSGKFWSSGNGVQAMARRCRQIERGILTVSNGLVKST